MSEERKKNEGRFHSLKLNLYVSPDSEDLFNKIKDPAKKAKIWSQWNQNRIKHGLSSIPYGSDVGPLLSSLATPEKEVSSGSDTSPSSSSSSDVEMSLPGTSRNTDTDYSQRPAKRIKTEGQVAEGGETISGQGTASAGALAETSGPEKIVRSPRNYANQGNLCFEKTHRVLAFGLANACLPHPDNDVTNNIQLMTTSLMEVPWDKPFFYLSPGELESLPKGAYVKSVNVKITQRNPRVAFETASSASSLATLNQNKFGIVAFGLNKKNGLRVTNRRYSAFNATEPMIPTETANATYNDIDTAMYGVDQSVAAFNGTIPSSYFMQPIQMPNYLTCWNSGHIAGQVTKAPGWYSLDEHIKQFDMQATSGTTIVDKTYYPSYAPLTEQTDFAEYLRGSLGGVDLSAYSYTDGDTTKQVSRINITNMDTNTSTIPSESFQVAPTNRARFNVGVGNRYDVFERGQFTKTIDRGDNPDCVQPSIHVGISPVPKLTTNANVIQPNSWTDVQIYYEIFTKMEIGFNFPHHNTHQSEFNIEANQIKMGVDNALINVDIPIRFGKYPSTFVAPSARTLPLQDETISSSSSRRYARN
uniref:Capsid protein n=1 Tax=Parvoviridae sp. TaxID=1940570 RepID=A0A893A8M0_9VIRU|nr:MAG: hypothetical protein 2 [Parvoviridae sp.]